MEDILSWIDADAHYYDMRNESDLSKEKIMATLETHFNYFF